MQYNSFEDSIRKQLLGAEMMPSPKVWENLEEELRTPPPPRRNPKWILGLFLLLTIPSVFFAIKATRKSPPTTVANNTQKPNAEVAVKSVHKDITCVEKTTPINTSDVTGNKKAETPHSAPKVAAKTYTEIIDVMPSASVATATQPFVAMESSAATAASPSTNLPELPKNHDLGEAFSAPIKENAHKSIALQEAQILPKGEITENAITRISPLFPSTPLPHFPDISTKPVPTPLLKNKSKRVHLWTSLGTSWIRHEKEPIENSAIASLRTSGDSATFSIENETNFNALTSGKSDVSEIKATVSSETSFWGVGANYKVSKHLSVDVGTKLHVQNITRFIFKQEKVNNYSQLVTNSLEKASTIEDARAQRFRVYVLELPIHTNYHFNIGHSVRSGYLASMGMSYRLLSELPTNTIRHTGKSAITQTSRNNLGKVLYNAHNYTLNLRLGYQYQLKSNLALFTYGNAQWLFKPMYSKYISSKTPALFGIEAGLRF